MAQISNLSLAEICAQLPENEQQNWFNGLNEDEARALLYAWEFWARPQQLPPDGDWHIWLILAGRGFGKTRAGAEWVRHIAAEYGKEAKIALIAASFHEARAVMVEGESGLLNIMPAEERPEWLSSLRRIIWPNGAEAQIYSAASPEALRGPQHSHVWCDEIAKWDMSGGKAQSAWDNMKMGVRLGDNPQILATTTPRNVPLLKLLLEREGQKMHVTRGSTMDNKAHLPASFLAEMAMQYDGTTLGRQELLGEMLEEVDGALWSRALLERCRAEALQQEEYRRIVVAVDPCATSGGDGCGIIVAGLTTDNHIHILADMSMDKASPEKWAAQAAQAAEIWGADRLIAEANQGGEMVKSVLLACNAQLPVQLVHASRGKTARAEPVAALYEAGRVFHTQVFARLEDECCGLMTGGGYHGPGRSPDRADALVWACHELLLKRRVEPKVW